MQTGVRIALIALVIIALLLSSISCASNRKIDRRIDGIYHVVKPGQNLYRISLTYGVELQQVAQINGISDPSVIQVGQKIFIPGANRVLDVPVITATTGAIPMLPVAGTITSGFGALRKGHRHTGIDIASPRGSDIRAVLPGVVIFSGTLRDYGKTVKLRHENGLVTLYAHNEKNLVKNGQRVKQGQTIATVGRSGNTTGYHLHFEVRKAGKPIDPMALLLPSSEYGNNHLSR
jgi:murein DD-endopeptidase MepM/ murein hydrolase activator NlpD